MVFTRITKRGEADDDEQPLRLRRVDRDPATLKSAVVEGMTSAVIYAKHNYFTLKWKESPTFRSCHTALQDTIMLQENVKITQCMCLGLGTFTGDDPERDNDDEDRNDSLHAAGTKFAIEHVYFQDPAFSDLDEKLLEFKGYEIIHTPKSDDYMSETTFLFTPGVEADVQESSLAAAYPALYVTHELRLGGKSYVPPLKKGVVEYKIPTMRPAFQSRLTDFSELRQHKERVQAAEVGGRRKLLNGFLSQRAVTSLPDSISDNWFHSMCIYYKPDSDADVSPVELELKGKSYTYKHSKKLWRLRGLVTADDVCKCCCEREGELSPDSSDAEDEASPKTEQTPKAEQASKAEQTPKRELSPKTPQGTPTLQPEMESLTLSEEGTVQEPTSTLPPDTFENKAPTEGAAPAQ